MKLTRTKALVAALIVLPSNAFGQGVQPPADAPVPEACHPESNAVQQAGEKPKESKEAEQKKEANAKPPIGKEVGAAVGGTAGQVAGAAVAGPLGAAAGGVIVGRIGEAVGSIFKKDKDKDKEPKTASPDGKGSKETSADAATPSDDQCNVKPAQGQ